MAPDAQAAVAAVDAQLAAIQNASLKNKDGTTILAKELWQTSPVVLLCIRRPGCVLCRDEAQKVYALKAELDGMGVRLVGVVHEWIDREIKAFVEGFWPGELYHDVDKTLYKAFGDGKLRKKSPLVFLNPWSKEMKRAKEAGTRVKDSNLIGDGLTLGGVIVVRKGDQGVELFRAEESFGEYPREEEILAAARVVASA